jgi:hypothetical protein
MVIKGSTTGNDFLQQTELQITKTNPYSRKTLYVNRWMGCIKSAGGLDNYYF